MKKILLLALIIPAISFSATWETVKQGDLFLIQDRDNKKVVHQMNFTGDRPQIIAVNKKYKDLELIEYNAGDNGTSTIIRTVRRAIFDSKNNKFLGDQPYKLSIVGDSEKTIDSPVWIIDEKTREIKITSEVNDIDVTIKY